jgi:hypothetical protein
MLAARKLAASALGFAMINGTLVPSVSGGALTVSLKTVAGNDPSATDKLHARRSPSSRRNAGGAKPIRCGRIQLNRDSVRRRRRQGSR